MSPQKNKPVLFIASDHAAVDFKTELQKLVPDAIWNDLGPSTKESVDYPDFAKLVCDKVLNEKDSFGILLCGSGVGMSIAANKVKGIRAVLANEPVTARLSREHNQANVLCMGARIIAPQMGAELLRAFLKAEIDPNPRHLDRIKKISKLE